VTRVDFLRAAAIVGVSAALGLLANAFSARPVPVFSSQGPGTWPDRAPRVTVEEVRAAYRDNLFVAILDVRDEAEFRKGHPEAAYHTPYESFSEALNRQSLGAMLKAARLVVLVCESENCSTADRAAEILNDTLGVPARVLEGGWKAYRDSGLP
jgi:rhodanese-related sulfurtransferase